MYCTRKHLLFDKSYIISIDAENIKIGESTQNIKYVIPLKLQTMIDWKVIEETQQLEAFAIQWRNEWKFFYADQNVCSRVKKRTDGRVVYKNMDTFYKTVERIETKAFSSVRTIQRLESEQIYICKEMKKQKKYAPILFQNEVDTLKQLNHQNIIKIFEAYENDYQYQIVLEYLKGGSLKQCLKYCKLQTEEIEIIMKQILEGLAYMHSQGYVHRDIKPENILFSDLGKFQSLKIIDFGIAKKISDLAQEKDMRFGTPGFMAPEILNPQQKKQLTEKIDVFSSGVIFYQMLTGGKLVSGRSMTELQDNNKNFVFDERLLSKIHQQKYKDLIQKMIAIDPQNRISAREALNSLFLININLQGSLSLSLQCPQEPVQQLPNFKELIKKL